jgi:hypothetical protein
MEEADAELMVVEVDAIATPWRRLMQSLLGKARCRHPHASATASLRRLWRSQIRSRAASTTSHLAVGILLLRKGKEDTCIMEEERRTRG